MILCSTQISLFLTIFSVSSGLVVPNPPLNTPTSVPPIFKKLTEVTTEYSQNFNKEFLTCDHIAIEPDEYKILENGDVYIEAYFKTYGPRDYYIQDQNVFVCIPTFEIKQNPKVHETLSDNLNKSLESLKSITTHKTIKAPLTDLAVPPIFKESVLSLRKLEYQYENQNSDRSLNCSNYAVYHKYILLENGSLVLPGSEEVYDYDAYFLLNNTAVLCTQEESTQATTEVADNFSKEFIACGHILIEPKEYKLLENGDVHIKMYSETYGPRDYYMQENGVYVCIPMFEKMKQNLTTNETLSDDHVNKFSVSFAYVTYFGLCLSTISLLAHLVVFCSVSSVRNLPGCCLASLSLSLLIAYLCFLTVDMVDTEESCADIGLCVYYFFLTSFFWMNAIAFDVWRSFRSVMRELRISSNRISWRRFLLYSLYSWVTPGVFTILVKSLDSSDVLPEDWKPSFGDTFCWFGQRKALLVFFAVPLIVIMVLNAVFFLDFTYVISRATLKTSQSHEATLKKRFFMFMRLALMMGLTWIAGLIAGYADNAVMWYLFIILNTLQGLFIFVVFSFSSKVRGLFCKKYRNSYKKRYSTSVRTISQMSAAV